MSSMWLRHPLPYGLSDRTSKADFWPTPAPCTESLITASPPPLGEVLDPCAGDGAILRVLADHGYNVWANELRDEETDTLISVCGMHRVTIGDWLHRYPDWRDTGQSIVTNPPFSIAPRIAVACFQTNPPYCALLLRCNTLGSASWVDVWREYPPTSIYPLIKRPSFTGDGKTDAAEYMWCVWVEGHSPIDLRPV